MELSTRTKPPSAEGRQSIRDFNLYNQVLRVTQCDGLVMPNRTCFEMTPFPGVLPRTRAPEVGPSTQTGHEVPDRHDASD